MRTAGAKKLQSANAKLPRYPGHRIPLADCISCAGHLARRPSCRARVGARHSDDPRRHVRKTLEGALVQTASRRSSPSSRDSRQGISSRSAAASTGNRRGGGRWGPSIAALEPAEGLAPARKRSWAGTWKVSPESFGAYPRLAGRTRRARVTTIVFGSAPTTRGRGRRHVRNAGPVAWTAPDGKTVDGRRSAPREAGRKGAETFFNLGKPGFQDGTREDHHRHSMPAKPSPASRRRRGTEILLAFKPATLRCSGNGRSSPRYLGEVTGAGGVSAEYVWARRLPPRCALGERTARGICQDSGHRLRQALRNRRALIACWNNGPASYGQSPAKGDELNVGDGLSAASNAPSRPTGDSASKPGGLTGSLNGGESTKSPISRTTPNREPWPIVPGYMLINHAASARRYALELDGYAPLRCRFEWIVKKAWQARRHRCCVAVVEVAGARFSAWVPRRRRTPGTGGAMTSRIKSADTRTLTIRQRVLSRAEIDPDDRGLKGRRDQKAGRGFKPRRPTPRL